MSPHKLDWFPNLSNIELPQFKLCKIHHNIPLTYSLQSLIITHDLEIVL